MGILCITNQNTPTNIKELLNHNHRLYAHLHKQNIKYTDSIFNAIDFICDQNECLIISELYAFINTAIDYRSIIDDNYLYLIAKSKPYSIANTYNQILITVTSEWTKLFWKDLQKHNMSIIEYISMHISLDSSESELQNIKLLTSPISVSIEDINKFKTIPKRVLLTDIYNTSVNIMRDNIIGINKYLGINHGNF